MFPRLLFGLWPDARASLGGVLGKAPTTCSSVRAFLELVKRDAMAGPCH